MKKTNKQWGLILTTATICALLAGCQTADASATNDDAASEDSAATQEVQDSASDLATNVPEYEGYTLLWNDEFEGNTLNMDIWNNEVREPGWTNNELQEYTDGNNVFLEDGNAVIKAMQTIDDNNQLYYTSGKLTTKNKQDFLYGKVIVRAKVPEGQGLWPAIWMMPTDESYYGQWPKCGEIDIMETLGHQTHIAYGTIHYGEPHAEQQGIYTLTDGETFSNSFHEYSVEWEPGEMRFYIDGNLYHTVNDWFTALPREEDKPYPAPFDQTFFLQMNLAVGGNWPGNPDETTDFENAEFLIDYVRVYQKETYDTNVQKPEVNFREPFEDGNYLYNGDFSETEDLLDEANWRFLLFSGGEGDASITDQVLTITTTQSGSEEYSVQVVQAELPMYKGKNYRVTFDAYSAENRSMVVCISAPTAGWVRYLPDTKIDLTTEWTSYSFDFSMTQKTDNNGRLEFNMGKTDSIADIYIRNIRVEIIE